LGGETQGGWGGSTVKKKGTPVLGQRSEYSSSNIDVNLFLIPRLSHIDQSFWTDEITSIARTIAQTETYLREGFLPSKIALICEKTALIFSEYSILLPIGLSGAESTQKITANSTYWEAKLKGSGGIARSKGKEHPY
jgi:hypothetical protein